MVILTCDDSADRAAANQLALHITRERAAELGRQTLIFIKSGVYISESGRPVEWGDLIDRSKNETVSIPPDAELPGGEVARFSSTKITISNETTLSAAQRLVQEGHRPLALNFANGIHPCGGFLSGSRAQEEYLCRSSGLFAALQDDRMYKEHRKRSLPDSTDWAILSTGVPVIRSDDGSLLDEPWLVDVITSAAPYAPKVGLEESSRLLKKRIYRILEIARAYRYSALVLGAWGCGAFKNDPRETALSFREALTGEFAGSFAEVVFAITDRSLERRTFGPFCEVFSETA